MKLSDLQQIISDQKKEMESFDIGIERDSLQILPDLQSHALIISGIRRCGKSTLLHQYIKLRNKIPFYLNFEDIRLYNFELLDFTLLDTLISDSGTRVLFFDEIQIIKGWEMYIRQKLDQHFQVIITGSNASLLSIELGTKLTGRHITKELFPFSYKEFLLLKNEVANANSLFQYIENGGFPEYLKTGIKEILNTLVDDIIYRDIAVRYSIKDVKPLKYLCSWMLSNVGNLVSPTKLTTAIGVKSGTTVLEYLSHFESSYLFNLVQKFSYSAKAQMLAAKKIYAIDTGLIQVGSLSYTSDKGHLLENIVYWHLRRKYSKIYYFNESGSECDFLAFEGSELVEIIQVCYELNRENEKREIHGIIDVLKFFNQKKATIITFSQTDLILIEEYEIKVVSAYTYLIN